MPKYEVIFQKYIYKDGWINYEEESPLNRYASRREAEFEYGRFYDRLPKGKQDQVLKVFTLWRLEKNGYSYDEVVGYIIENS